MDSHPDRNPDDAVAAARFKEASEAYAVLSDPDRRRSYDLFGHSAVGAGRILRHPCAVCRGQGRVQKARRLSVKVPAGVDMGSQIRISGEGEAGVRGGPPGDLYVVLRVKAHPHLARHEQDIVYELRINIVQASLGDRIEIPTIEGAVEIPIPPGTQHGQSFRLARPGL